ncbi:MAG: hypothetical protein K6F97_08405 [Lachnospiraceae bacterium]|jgi:hypothetical protein|nr:hypothetical protein [Lachnospiraceae bacterium]HAP33486.1 hypothetical protein [Lachnospiraceae bacterium]HBR04987.1 hypothetical protein [Lachnospiraceae bacterium]HBZ90440.1 hypothetical protein [Lachnospiraceae bacterium]
MGKLVDFRMSREDLLHPGDRIEVAESTLSTLSGTVYYYTIIPALAMSNNMNDPLDTKTGTVKDVVVYGSEWTVTVEMDEA